MEYIHICLCNTMARRVRKKSIPSVKSCGSKLVFKDWDKRSDSFKYIKYHPDESELNISSSSPDNSGDESSQLQKHLIVTKIDFDDSIYRSFKSNQFNKIHICKETLLQKAALQVNYAPSQNSVFCGTHANQAVETKTDDNLQLQQKLRFESTHQHAKSIPLDICSPYNNKNISANVDEILGKEDQFLLNNCSQTEASPILNTNTAKITCINSPVLKKTKKRKFKCKKNLNETFNQCDESKEVTVPEENSTDFEDSLLNLTSPPVITCTHRKKKRKVRKMTRHKDHLPHTTTCFPLTTKPQTNSEEIVHSNLHIPHSSNLFRDSSKQNQTKLQSGVEVHPVDSDNNTKPKLFLSSETQFTCQKENNIVNNIPPTQLSEYNSLPAAAEQNDGIHSVLSNIVKEACTQSVEVFNSQAINIISQSIKSISQNSEKICDVETHFKDNSKTQVETNLFGQTDSIDSSNIIMDVKESLNYNKNTIFEKDLEKSPTESTWHISQGSINSACSPVLRTDSSQQLNISASENSNYSELSTTPTKDGNARPNYSTVIDSAKKKKKVKKGGIADRLQKVLSKQRSSKCFWQHEAKRVNCQNLSIKKDCNSGTYLRVQYISRAGSQLFIWCKNEGIGTYSSDILDNEPSGEGVSYPKTDISDSKSHELVVLLNEVTRSVSQMVPHSVIRLYPPWQSLNVHQLSITLIMNVTHIEVISNDLFPIQCTPDVEIEQTKLREQIFGCSCLRELSLQSKCNMQLPNNGQDILRILFSHQTDEEIPFNLEQIIVCNKGTISEALLDKNLLHKRNINLVLSVEKVFSFRSKNYLNSTRVRNTFPWDFYNELNELEWSILGRDIAGEFCEVLIKPSGANISDDTSSTGEEQLNILPIFDDIKTRQVLGRVYRFTQLVLYKRLSNFKMSRLHGLLCHIPSEGTVPASKEETNQIYFHLFSPAKSALNTQLLKDPTVMLCYLKTDSISNIYGQRNQELYSRCTFLVKILFIDESTIYVCDMSLSIENEPVYACISIKSSCFIPKIIANAIENIAYIQDIQVHNGKLTADRYTQIWPSSLCLKYKNQFKFQFNFDETDIMTIKDKEVILPFFNEMSLPKSLVTVTGLIVGVDDDTAYSWPVCATCSCENLDETTEKKIFCRQCGKETDIITKLSLEVYLSCCDVNSKIQVKIKLLQDTILRLLPKNSNPADGYEITSILNKEVGPISCFVHNRNIIESEEQFTLEEI